MAVQHSIPSVITLAKRCIMYNQTLKSIKFIKQQEHMWKTGVSTTLFATELWIHIITPDWPLVYLLNPL